jgi:hypothetical protein
MVGKEYETSVTLLEEYEKEQHELARIYKAVAQTLMIPALDPTKDFVINVGCGGSPDQIALQTLADPDVNQVLPVVGIDLVLYGLRGDPKAKIREGDNVELIKGDATKVIPEVVRQRGQPSVIVARNVDAMFLAANLDPKFLAENPHLNTSWHDVIQRIYEALPEAGGFFITTYKNTLEFVPLVSYIQDVGFIACPIEIQRPDRRNILQKLRSALSFEIPQTEVRDDQFVMVGVKNPSDQLLAKFQEQDPSFTRESIQKEREEAKRWKERVKRAGQYDCVNEDIELLSKEVGVDMLLNFLMRMEVDLPDVEIDRLRALASSPGKVIVRFLDERKASRLKEDRDMEPTRSSFWKRGLTGSKQRMLIEDEDSNEGGRGNITLSRSTIYEYPEKGQKPTGNELIPTGEVVVSDIVGVFCSPAQLEVAERLIEIALEKKEK